ncbi:hypothetical protein SCUP515_02202 [Seiridium cupressi]
MTGNKRSRGRDDPRDDESRKKRRDGRSRSSSPEILPRSDLQGNSRSVTRTTQKKEMAFEKSIRAIQDAKVEIPPITMKLDSYELPAQLYTGHDAFQMTAKDPNGQYIFAKIPDRTQKGSRQQPDQSDIAMEDEKAPTAKNPTLPLLVSVPYIDVDADNEKSSEAESEHDEDDENPFEPEHPPENTMQESDNPPTQTSTDPTLIEWNRQHGIEPENAQPRAELESQPSQAEAQRQEPSADEAPVRRKRGRSRKEKPPEPQAASENAPRKRGRPRKVPAIDTQGTRPASPPRESETPQPRFRRRTHQPNYTADVGPEEDPADNDSGNDDGKIGTDKRKRKIRSPRAKPKLPRKPADDTDAQLNMQQHLQHYLPPLKRDCIEAERWSPVVMLKSAFPDGEGIEEMLADAKTRFDQTADKVVADDPSSNEGNPLYKACLRRWRLYPTQLISFDNGLVFANTTDSALPKETINTAWKQTWCRELRKVILHPVWGTSIHFLLLSLQFTIMCRTDDRRSWQPCWDVDPKFGQYYEELDDAQVSPRQIPRCIKARYRNSGKLIPIICQVFVAIARQARQTYDGVDAIERDDSQRQSFPRCLTQPDLFLLIKALDGMREEGAQKFGYNTADASALFLDSREGHRNNNFDFPRKDNGEYLQTRRHAYEQLVYKLVAHEKKVEQGTWTLREAMRNLPPDRSMLMEQDKDYVESDANEFPGEGESDLGVEETPPPRRRGMDNRQSTEKARERRELDQGHDDAMDTSDGGMDRSS